MQAHALEGGFADLPVDASFAFRAIMQAMAQPGCIVTLAGAKPPAPVSVAAGAVLLTLCDPDTAVCLAPGHDTPQARAWVTFHTGAPLCAATDAQFVVGRWGDLSLDVCTLGTAEYPDRSATLIVELPELANTGAILRGPGIKDQTALSLPEIAAFQRNNTMFPLGLDFIFTCGDRLAALPRSTRVG